MKLKIDWKNLGKQIWEAVKPVLLAAVGGGLTLRGRVGRWAGASGNAPTRAHSGPSALGEIDH